MRPSRKTHKKNYKSLKELLPSSQWARSSVINRIWHSSSEVSHLMRGLGRTMP